MIVIPALLICVEMAFFAVMHIFAFSWQPYRIQPGYNDPTISAGIGYGSSTPKYLGGPLGIKAFLDAMNPWDIIKASARGFRWLFVGVRHRKDDPSYQQKSDTLDDGPVYMAPGEVATELRPSNDGRGRPSQANAPGEDDRAGLLQNPGGFGRVPTRNNSPYQAYGRDAYTPGEESQYDIGTAMPYGHSKASDYGESADTAYHSTPQQQHPMIHPALREQAIHDPNWNMFGGASKSTGQYPHDEEYPERI